MITRQERTATIYHAATDGNHATTLELLYKLPGDEEFGHSTAITRPSQVLGPFPADTLVTFINRVANSTPGVVWSQPVAVQFGG